MSLPPTDEKWARARSKRLSESDSYLALSIALRMPAERMADPGLRVCTMCGCLIFETLIGRHQRFCEPRSLDLEPLSPTETG